MLEGEVEGMLPHGLRLQFLNFAILSKSWPFSRSRGRQTLFVLIDKGKYGILQTMTTLSNKGEILCVSVRVPSNYSTLIKKMLYDDLIVLSTENKNLQHQNGMMCNMNHAFGAPLYCKCCALDLANWQ